MLSEEQEQTDGYSDWHDNKPVPIDPQPHRVDSIKIPKLFAAHYYLRKECQLTVIEGDLRETRRCIGKLQVC
jgi:hypothetical protein